MRILLCPDPEEDQEAAALAVDHAEAAEAVAVALAAEALAAPEVTDHHLIITTITIITDRFSVFIDPITDMDTAEAYPEY